MDVDKNRIRAHYTYLTECLEIDQPKFLSSLISQGILLRSKQSDLKKKAKYESQVVANSTLLHYIESREEGYEAFIKALAVSEQHSIIKHIHPEHPLATIEPAKDETPEELDISDDTALSIDKLQPWITDGDNFTGITSDPKSNGIYKKRKNGKNRCVVVNIVNYKNHKKLKREGSDVDFKNCCDLFGKLGYTVVEWLDTKREELRKNLEKESKLKDHKEADSFILIILAHGERGHIITHDNEKVSIDNDIISYFTDDNCPNLKNKPKLFFIQACQGSETTKGVALPEGNGSEPAPQVATDVTDAQKPASLNSSSPPSVNDTLVLYSTFEGFKSFRHVDFGSWFIVYLVKVIITYAHYLDLESMATKVAYYLNQKATKQYTEHKLPAGLKQVSMSVPYNFNKKFYFFYGVDPETLDEHQLKTLYYPEEKKK